MKRKAAALIAALLMLSACSVPETAETGPADAAEAAEAEALPGAADAAEDSDSPERGSMPRSGRLACRYFDSREYDHYDAVSTAYETDGKLLCGVAPHHLTAGHFIAELYKTAAAASNEIETVVLAAPMHYKSEHKLCTSIKDWDTAYGVLKNDTELTALLCGRRGAVPDDEMTELDHSASSHIPFIKRYLPDAKVAVLLVSPDAGRNFPAKLAELMLEMSEMKNCLFAFSIDFSHYLSPDRAEYHDAETLRAVMEGDTSVIERFTNDNVDTPYCLSAFVRLSELLGADINTAEHGNTFSIGNAPYSTTRFPEGVTSYFVFLSFR